MGICRQFAHTIGFKKTTLVTCTPRIQKSLIKDALTKFYRTKQGDSDERLRSEPIGTSVSSTSNNSRNNNNINNNNSSSNGSSGREVMSRDETSKLASVFMKAMRSASHKLDPSAMAFVQREYTDMKKRGNMMDFDDYITFATKIMSTKKGILKYLLKVSISVADRLYIQQCCIFTHHSPLAIGTRSAGVFLRKKALTQFNFNLFLSLFRIY